MRNDVLANAEEALGQGRHDDALAFLHEALAGVSAADAEATVAEALALAQRIPGDEARKLAQQLEGAQRVAATRSPPVLGLLSLAAVIGAMLVVFLQATGSPATPASSDFPPAGVLNPGRMLAGEGVYLAPIGRFEAVEPERLAAGLERDYGIRAEVLPTVMLAEYAYDPDRKQLDADNLLHLLRNKYMTESRETVVIGLTDFDMFRRSAPEFRFMFSARNGAGYAVVSAARMGPTFLDRIRRRDPDDERVRTMVDRNVAVLFFRIALRGENSSVLRREIGSVADIDAVEGGIPPERRRGRSGEPLP